MPPLPGELSIEEEVGGGGGGGGYGGGGGGDGGGNPVTRVSNGMAGGADLIL